VFACPKPLGDAHVETIQRNAIASWTRLPGGPDVILFGDESAARLADDLGTRYSDEIAYTATGAPLLDSLFPAAERLAAGDLLAYVNADVVLMSDFAAAVSRVSRRSAFLMVGRRTDLAVVDPLDFDEGWDARLRERALRDGRLHSHVAIDYFVFRAGLYEDIPPLAVGRASFDNWLIRKARDLGAAVVDATPVVLAVHQDHDYGHVAGGEAEVYSGAEAERNMELAGGAAKLFFIHDASHVLTRRGLLPAVAPRYLRHRWWRYSRSSRAVAEARRIALGVRLRVKRLFA
jgi:hypothetical protein